MQLDLGIVNRIKSKILKAEKILIISHRRPDADTIGANLSLRRALLEIGKDVTSACHDEIGEENYSNILINVVDVELRKKLLHKKFIDFEFLHATYI